MLLLTNVEINMRSLNASIRAIKYIVLTIHLSYMYVAFRSRLLSALVLILIYTQILLEQRLAIEWIILLTYTQRVIQFPHSTAQ